MLVSLKTSSDVYLGLGALGMHGATDVGYFCKRLEQSQLSSTSGIGPKSGTDADLLLIPLSLAAAYFDSLDLRHHSLAKPEVKHGALGAIAALLCCIVLDGRTIPDHPILPVSKIVLGPGHFRTARHIWNSVVCFLERGAVPFPLAEHSRSLKERNSDYAGNPFSVKRTLVAAKVIPAWPKVGKACIVPIFDVVDKELQAELLAADCILLPEAEWPKVTPKSKVHASDDEWYLMCQAGYEQGMFRPIAESEFFKNNLGDKVTAGAMGSIRSRR